MSHNSDGIVSQGMTGHGGPSGFILAPVPVRSGDSICLYNGGEPVSASWQVYSVMGERIADLSSGPGETCWNTTGTASGIYFVRIKLTYSDGTSCTALKKIIVL
jgi:hypothetical protein